MDIEPKLTFIVACKGRLDHLRVSLPRLMAQPGCRTIVVDSNCPDGAAKWVSSSYPDATVVLLDDHGRFNLPKCRNAGLQRSQTEWVCFIDADVIVSRDFRSILECCLEKGAYYTFKSSNKREEPTGTCIVGRDDAIRMGGYDEAFEAWGGEDRDFYRRLEMNGVETRHFPDRLIETVMSHSDDRRTRYYNDKSLTRSFAVAALYGRAKRSVMALHDHRPLDLMERRGLYALAQQAVDRAAQASDKKSVLTCDVPKNSGTLFFGVVVSQKIWLEVDLSNAAGMPALAVTLDVRD
ncbi:MAG TPA: galactosyltransferase-related protein [Rhizomicrobium sp.]|nr:galactosyltransferase-related protein [Rhizomicrobium sp.]